MQCTRTQPIFKNTDDYYVHQINTGCLAQFSYYIESNKEAVIIDPIRESDQYLELIKERGSNLKYILETHFHADFVSGHLELSKSTGAKIVYGPTAETEFETYIAKDEEILPLGNVSIKVFHSPGHTIESTSYILMDKENQPKAFFSGDFLFLGEVGRPDLAVSSSITDKDLANYIFESIQKLKSSLPDDIVIFPGHGAGSACGKNISLGTSDTLGNQKKTNYALNENLTKEEFIEIVTSNLSTPPQYFFLDVMLNKKGHELVEKIVEKSLKPIIPEDFIKLAKDGNHVVIDSRDFNVSKSEFFKGSYLISLKLTYAIWAANLFTPEQKILLVTHFGQEKESIVRLARVGYENVIGYLDGGFPRLEQYYKEHTLEEDIVSLESVDLSNIKSQIHELSTKENVFIVDVREKSEWESTGIVPHSHPCSLKTLEQTLPELLSKANNQPFGVYCKTGGRASIAGSILKKHDIKKVYFLGGISNMIEQKVELESYKN
jgi:hydroxyacylglutathione hydrolase